MTAWESSNRLKPGWRDLVSLVFPKSCLGCGERIDEGWLCEECYDRIEFTSGLLCPRCGSPMQEGGTCVHCKTMKYRFDYAASVFPFDDMIRNLIHEMKYYGLSTIADCLIEKSAEFLMLYRPFDMRIDLVSPIPLHRVRRRERGYNQADRYAEGVAKAMGWRYCPDLLRRSRYTRTQTSLNREERKTNLTDAFVTNEDVFDKTILLVDDVFTSGSTASSAAGALKDAGARIVNVLTIARAGYQT